MKKWSKEEDKILKKEVGKHPTNLAEAFVAASEKLSRTPASCHRRWYSKVSKEQGKCFILLGNKSYSSNRKTIKHGYLGNENIPIKTTIWNKVIAILKGI